AAAAAAYKRASRKNAPRRFACDWPGCDKIYSRSEHLQRHLLNHAPREIYACDEPGCDHKFVRSDLLARHKKRHSPTYIPRTRNSSVVENVAQPYEQHFVHTPQQFTNPFSMPVYATQTSAIRNQMPLEGMPPAASTYPTHIPTTTWEEVPRHPQLDGSFLAVPSHTSSRESSQAYSAGSYMADHDLPGPAVGPRDASSEDFAVWLFDSQQIQNDQRTWAAPLVESGLESAFDSKIHFEQDPARRPQPQPDASQVAAVSREADSALCPERRDELIRWIQGFLQEQPTYQAMMPGLMSGATDGDIPNITVEVLRACVQQFWYSVAPRMPIVHQPSFALGSCPPALLLVIIALGASQMESSSSSIPITQYRALADLIITCVRWEILTADEASPPIELWVAQALVLVEFYEKMYSTRKLHERANIYHTAMITLLRRGSPLIGQAAAESPPDEHPPHYNSEHWPLTGDSREAWARWAQTEAMHRVVYGAFMMDIIHAAMFGHTADMAPQEIRLPLPCDDRLWTAPTPQAFRQIDVNLKSHGTQSPEQFLLGLKCAIHGKDINTHPFGRMIIMCGLLSVGWHLRNRETHLKWLELHSSSSTTREQWSRMLLRAFDGWKASFDRTLSFPDAALQAPPHSGGSRGGGAAAASQANGLIESAALLYHLARLSLYANIVDCQVYAGAKRVLGRKISAQEYGNVVSRMHRWATQPSTRLAVLHSFKLLRRVLLADDRRPSVSAEHPLTNDYAAVPTGSLYSCFGDTDPHRPWCIYYATLCIWTYVQAQPPRDTQNSNNNNSNLTPSGATAGHARPRSRAWRAPTSAAPGQGAIEYLSRMAALHDLDPDTTGQSLAEGLPELLDLVMSVLAEARSEILREAHHRLVVCRETL
ncbi:fungal-specific transcription factor domain-containing protein, partial [Microdochium trichocladiopsis]